MAARDSERYYWIKLDRGFFKRHDIEILEAKSKDYSLFYLKLMCESVDHEGYLRFNELIPYNAEMLATITHTDSDMVKGAMDALQALGMVQVLDDKTIYISDVAKRLGVETYAAQRQRDHRERLKLPGDNVTLPGDNVAQLSQICHQEIEIDKELDIELEIDRDVDVRNDISMVIECWNGLGLQKVTKIVPGSKREQFLRKRIKEYGIEAVCNAIERVRQSDFLQGKGKKGWEITFDWFILPANFPKVLEGNYDNKERKKYAPVAFDPGAINNIKI